MHIPSKLSAFAAAIALFTVPLLTSAYADPVNYRYGPAVDYRSGGRLAQNGPASGTRIYANGVRYTPEKGWDFTCHNVPHMMNRYACDAK
jgi:hypothetical protein